MEAKYTLQLHHVEVVFKLNKCTVDRFDNTDETDVAQRER